MKILSITLMFIGGIGFWPLIEFYEFITHKIKRKKYSFSFLSKLLVKLHVSIFIVSTFVIVFFENKHILYPSINLNNLIDIAFLSISARNAGFTLGTDLNLLNPATILVIIILMFIGASPNSTGGGIRTTTFAVLIKKVINFSSNDNSVIIGGRRIRDESVDKSSTIFMSAFLLIMVSFIYLVYNETNHSFESLLFELVSAFGTTGLSLGITESLSFSSKAVLVFVMFIGKIGLVSFILLLNPTINASKSYELPEMDIIIG